MSTANDLPQPSVIEPPPNFPVTWEQPADQQLLWNHERMHFPEPVTPLTEAVWVLCLKGFTRAAAAYRMGIRFAGCRINTYHYETITPVEALPDAEAAQQRSSEELLEATMARLGTTWATEWLPEIRAYLHDWENFDLAGAKLAALIAHLEQTIARMEHLWELHDLAMDPVLVAMSMFDDLYRDLFGAEQALEAYRLLQGFDNKTLETDRALWQLSRKAGQVPEMHKLLEDQSAGNLSAALEASSEGRAFLAELRAFLREYGQRSDLELSQPRWIEDPTPALTNLKDYLNHPERDPDAQLAALAAEREQLVVQTRARLQGYPEAVVTRFEFLLRAAQEATVLSEEHGFWIDQRSLYQVRRIALEFGRRFAHAGVLEAQDDVFYLTLDEIGQTAAALPQLDQRLLVAGRRAELEYFRTIAPPPSLGTLPEGAPPEDAVGRAIEKFFGAPPAPSAEADSIAGHAGSAGVVRGPARVIRTLADANRLEPGDILVAETTLPAWTPLFATAAAVVTDMGGVLSHCAVVAREYRIPAVVGTGIATATVEDGQLIEVDGTCGIVRLGKKG